MKYQDFIVKIESKSGDDYIISIESPAGEGSSLLTLPFAVSAAPTILQSLGATFRGAAAGDAASVVTREAHIESSPAQPESDLPNQLFQSLFSGAARTLFDQSLGMIRSSQCGLRIKLQIDPSTPNIAELASLPWELLYRSETRDYLSLSRDTPLVRYLNVQRPIDRHAFKPPLRILVVMSSPAGVPPLDLAAERKLIENSWGRKSGVEVDFLERPATSRRLSDQLAEKNYHVLHYMGHGDFDSASGKGVLLMEDDNGQPRPLDGETLGGVIMHDVKSMRLVFLNACNTAKVTRVKAQDPFAGVATATVMAGIPAVVAMQFPISDKAAIEFAGCFYPRIVKGFPVDAAVAEGRKAIKLADPASMEWATPALFMRSKDGHLFDIVDEPASAAARVKPVAAKPSASSPQPPAARPKFCRKCGEKALEVTKFCRKCGVQF